MKAVLSLSHTHTRIHVLSLSQARARALSLLCSLSLSRSLSLSLFLSFSLYLFLLLLYARVGVMPGMLCAGAGWPDPSLLLRWSLRHHAHRAPSSGRGRHGRGAPQVHHGAWSVGRTTTCHTVKFNHVKSKRNSHFVALCTQVAARA